MKTILASGAWVEHRPIQDLKAKDKDAVEMASKITVPLTADGEFDRSQGLVVTAATKIAKRNACIARVVTAWSYDVPVPFFEASEVHNAESIDQLTLDDINELEDLLAPYLAKLDRRPNPKAQVEATTTSSNGSSRANAHPSRTG